MPANFRTLPMGGWNAFGLKFTVTPNPITFDLTAITSIVWTVTRQDGTVVTWNPTISAQTASSLLTTYVLASDGSDLPILGTYSVAVTGDVSAGPAYPGTAFTFEVVPANRWTGQ